MTRSSFRRVSSRFRFVVSFAVAVVFLNTVVEQKAAVGQSAIGLPMQHVEGEEAIDGYAAAVHRVNQADQIPNANGSPTTIVPLAENRPKSEMAGEKQGDSATDPNSSSNSWVYLASFNSPCHFPLKGRGEFQQEFVRDALVVYEGMQIAIRSDGHYHLKFQAEVPRTAAVMRLQLTATTQDGLPATTLTIPPIIFDPNRDLGRHLPGRTVEIQHTGFSYPLRKLLGPNAAKLPKNSSLPIEGIVFRRTGVVRFGSKPERGEYSILPVEPTSENSSSAIESE